MIAEAYIIGTLLLVEAQARKYISAAYDPTHLEPHAMLRHRFLAHTELLSAIERVRREFRGKTVARVDVNLSKAWRLYIVRAIADPSLLCLKDYYMDDRIGGEAPDMDNRVAVINYLSKDYIQGQIVSEIHDVNLNTFAAWLKYAVLQDLPGDVVMDCVYPKDD